MKIAQTDKAGICAEIAKADITILLENKNLSDEVGQVFCDHLNRNRTGIKWAVVKISAGGIKSASTAEFYQILYRTEVDGKAVTLTVQTDLLVNAIQTNTRMDHFFQISMNAHNVIESSYRVPCVFDLAVGGDSVRMAAFHAPGPGTQMAPTITNQALNVLASPALETAFILGDFNCYGGGEPIPKFHPGVALKSRTEKFVWTGKRLGTTFRKKRGVRTKRRTSNPLDRVLVNRDAQITVEPTYDTNPLYYRVTDHIPIGAKVSFPAAPPPGPIATANRRGKPDRVGKLPLAIASVTPDLHRIAAMFNAGGTVALCDRTLGTQGFDALIKASGLVVADPGTSTITVIYSGPRLVPTGTKLIVPKLNWPIPGFNALAASATFELVSDGLAVGLDTGPNGPLMLGTTFTEMADDPLGEIQFAHAGFAFSFVPKPAPGVPTGLIFSGNFPLDLDGPAGWLKTIWGSNLPGSVAMTGPIANNTVDGVQFLSVDLRADLPPSPPIALPHYRMSGQLWAVYNGLAAAAGAWLEDDTLPSSGCYVDGSLQRDPAALGRERTLPQTIPVTVLWIPSGGGDTPDLYLAAVGDNTLPVMALTDVADLLLSGAWLAALPSEIQGWLAHVNIQQLRIATGVTADEQQLYEAAVDVVMSDTIKLFEIGDATLSLEWLSMTVGTFQTAHDHELSFGAALILGNQREFDLSLTFTEQEILIGGSYFDPDAGTSDALSLHAIIGEIAGEATAALVPDELATIAIDRIDALVAYRDRSFACDAYFSAELMGIGFSGLAIRAVRSAAQDDWAAQFGGVIDIASVLFEISGVLDKQGDKVLTIAWPPSGDAMGEKLTLNMLLTEIGFGIALPAGLDFALTSAKFCYVFDAATGTRVLTLEAEVTLDGIAATVQALSLSPDGDGASRRALIIDVPIPDTLTGLPVVGDLPNPVSLLQLVGTSTDLSGDVEEVNTALAAMGSTVLLDPDALQEGVHLSIQLAGVNAPITITLGEAPHAAAEPTARTAVPAAVLWEDVDRALGPILLHRVRIGWASTGVALVLDCSITAGGIAISFQECGLTIPLDHPTHVGFTLGGLGIDYSAPPISIGGGFLAMPGGEYDGDAVIQTPSISLTALGGYRAVDGHMAMFVYGMLDNPPLGGPAFCYVTGVAAGFGYNRQLNVPALPDVASFPLVAAADPDDPEAQKSFSDMAADLANVMPAAVGENWLAAGLRFTSFELVRSFALLTVSFGPSVEVALLGKSTAAVPSDSPLLHAAIVLSAAYSPDEGVLRANGMLTPDSYVISPDCALSGGFAVYVWFKDQPGGPNAGDFVVSVGGFAPGYSPPPGYPSVAPLALNWHISDEITASGQGYAALTPSCVMAGGSYAIRFEAGCLKAWFDAAISFYMGWKPYSYDLVAEIDIGVSLSFDVDLLFSTVTVTLYADIGAGVHIWGPDFTGDVHVKVAFVSFTIGFGEGQTKPPFIDWDEFKSSFLADTARPVCSVRLVDGGLRTLPASGSASGAWVVDANRLVLRTHCLVPASSEAAGGATGAAFGIRPVGIAASDDLRSIHVVEIFRGTKQRTNWFDILPVVESVPKALWGDPATGGPDQDQLLPGVLTGVTITAKVASVSPDKTKGIPVTNLLVQSPASSITAISWSADAVPAPAPDQRPATRWHAVENIVAAAPARDAILADLHVAGLDLPTHIDLGGFGRNIHAELLDAPLLLAIAETRHAT
ncbi:DUF6603 domain-containing protein [Sphingomonas sp. GB1N7]|uniref:DUF6603 domain-containing protein n=1 Tax=Parasphingomonas caseinilytica TaxID=3096158 RepID=UPI002FC7158A